LTDSIPFVTDNDEAQINNLIEEAELAGCKLEKVIVSGLVGDGVC